MASRFDIEIIESEKLEEMDFFSVIERGNFFMVIIKEKEGVHTVKSGVGGRYFKFSDHKKVYKRIIKPSNE